MIKNKKSVKRITWSIIVVLLLCFTMGSHTFAAESGKCGNSLTWSFKDGVLTITGSGKMEDYSDDKLPPWYEYRDQINAVKLPEGIESIGDVAFFNCINLKDIVLPEKVNTIGEYSFAECTGLLTINFPQAVTEIKEAAFSECYSLKMIQFPDHLRIIGSKAFYRCYSLTTIVVPASVEVMGVQVFAYCNGLIRATVEANISVLSPWTFYCCENLKSVSLASTITSVDVNSFTGCERLAEVYTETYEFDIAQSIENEIIINNPYFEEIGFVAAFEQPESTIMVDETESEHIITQVYESKQATVKVTTVSDYSPDRKNDSDKVSVDASVSENTGWTYVAEKVSDVVSNYSGENALVVGVNLTGTTIEAEKLRNLCGKRISLTIVTSTGIHWTFDTSELAKRELAGVYELGVSIKEAKDEINVLKAEDAYKIDFLGKIDFPATVGIPLPSKASQAASIFYDVSDDALMIVRVDKSNLAWYPFKEILEKASYYIGINVLDTQNKNVVIPKSMYDEYGSLSNINGAKFQITGRTSRWGITGGQYALYVGLALGFIIAVVTVVMIFVNRTRNRKLALANAQEEKIDEQALYDEVLKEVPEETKNKQKK